MVETGNSKPERQANQRSRGGPTRSDRPPAEKPLRGRVHRFAENEFPLVRSAHATLVEFDDVAVIGLGGLLSEHPLCGIETVTRTTADYYLRPLRTVSEAADRISTGEIDQPPLVVRGRDEIAEVTTSFNRMHTSLKKAMEMLGDS